MNFEIRNGDVLEELEKLNAERRRFDAMSRERLTNALKVYETTGTLVDDVNNQRELLFV
jgi:hypothetical protein